MATIKYGKFNQFKFGAPGYKFGAFKLAFDYKVHLLDSGGTLQKVLNSKAINFSYQWLAEGGCGPFQLTFKERYFDRTGVNADWEVRLYVQKETGTGFDLWYTGIVESVVKNVAPIETTVLTGTGYMGQLQRVVVDRTISSSTVKVAVQSILDTEIVPNTDITYDAGDIAGDFTLDTIAFEDTGFDAIKKLADIQGSVEWGVDKDKKFFFKARSTSVSHRFIVGKDVALIEDTRQYKDIVNRMYLKGGLTGGSLFTRTLNDADSQTKYGLRELLHTDASIISSDVADQFGTSFFAYNATPSRRLRVNQIAGRVQLESSVPLGQYVLKSTGVFKFGDRKFGHGIFGEGAETGKDIHVIDYQLTDLGMDTTLEAGKKKPDVTQVIDRLFHEIKQLRNRDQ